MVLFLSSLKTGGGPGAPKKTPIWRRVVTQRSTRLRKHLVESILNIFFHSKEKIWRKLKEVPYSMVKPRRGGILVFPHKLGVG